MLIACDIPRDPAGTLSRIRGGELRVGVAEHPPWTTIVHGRVEGIEPRLVAALASEIGARPVWRVGSESELLEALHARQLDLVVGGLTDDSPWRGTVAFTAPHFTDTLTARRHVFAVAPGENAWQTHIERFFESHERTRSLADEEGGR